MTPELLLAGMKKHLTSRGIIAYRACYSRHKKAFKELKNKFSLQNQDIFRYL